MLAAGCTSHAGPSRPPATSHQPAETIATVSLPWVDVGHQNPLVIDIVVADGGCDSYTHLVSTQTATEVRITAVGLRVSRPGVPCTADLHGNTTLLALSRPLAGRRLVHAPVAPGWRSADQQQAVRRLATSMATQAPGH